MNLTASAKLSAFSEIGCRTGHGIRGRDLSNFSGPVFALSASRSENHSRVRPYAQAQRHFPAHTVSTSATKHNLAAEFRLGGHALVAGFLRAQYSWESLRAREAQT